MALRTGSKALLALAALLLVPSSPRARTDGVAGVGSLLVDASPLSSRPRAESQRPLPPLAESVRRDLRRRTPGSYEVAPRSPQGPPMPISQPPSPPQPEQGETVAPPNNITGIVTQGTVPNSFVFSFDDGPYDKQRDIVDLISGKGGKATFFVNGNNYGCIYDQANVDRLNYALSKGFDVCSHTWSHVHLNSLTYEQIDREVQLVEDALWKVAGIVPSCFRPPFGEANDTVVEYLNNKWGYVTINWNYDSGDSVGASVDESMKVYRTIKSPTNAIVLNHETETNTPGQLVPQAIDYVLGEAGYKPENLLSASAAIGFVPWKVRGQPGQRDASWTCDDKPPTQQDAKHSHGTKEPASGRSAYAADEYLWRHRGDEAQPPSMQETVLDAVTGLLRSLNAVLF